VRGTRQPATWAALLEDKVLDASVEANEVARPSRWSGVILVCPEDAVREEDDELLFEEEVVGAHGFAPEQPAGRELGR
jgi:hypothetical protein